MTNEQFELLESIRKLQEAHTFIIVAILGLVFYMLLERTKK